MQQVPYERQESESKKAFEAFRMYRDLGAARSIRKVAQELDKSVALISRWSAAHDWVDRVNAYDQEMDRQALLEQEKERRQMVKRHAKQAMMFQSKVVERIKKLKPEELSASDMIRWFESAVKIERLARGETTEKAEVTHNGEVKERYEYDITQRIEQYEDIYSKVAAERGETESHNEGNGT